MQKKKYGIRKCAVTAVAVMFMCSLGLGGCSAPEETKKEAQDRKTVITIWTQDRHDLPYQQERVRRYNETNTDNVQVEYQVFTENYVQALDNAFQNGTAPDLMGYNNQVFGNYVGQGRFAVISAYWDEEFGQIFGPVMEEGVNVIDGKCYYIPTRASISRLFYNRDLFQRAGIERPPVTMEEMIEDARQITGQFAGEGIYGFAVNLKNPRSAIDRTIMKQGNLEYGLKTGFDFARGSYDFLQYQPLLESWQQLLGEDCSYPDCFSLDIDPLRQLFADGKVGMYISYTSADMNVYRELFRTDQNWGCAPLPTVDDVQTGTQNYSLQGGYLFNAGTKNMKLLWKVYQELFGNVEYLTDYSAHGLGVTAVPTVREALQNQNDEIFLENPQLGITETDSLWPKAPQERYGAAVSVSGPDMYDTIGEILLGKVEVESSLKDLSDRYNAAYETGIANHIGKDMRIPGFDPMEPMKNVGGTETPEKSAETPEKSTEAPEKSMETSKRGAETPEGRTPADQGEAVMQKGESRP